jgi:hypothetical protein
MQARRKPLKNACLADVCIGTSAAPTFLPAHYFETVDHTGASQSFNIIDGGMAANNPVCFFFIIFLKLSTFVGFKFLCKNSILLSFNNNVYPVTQYAFFHYVFCIDFTSTFVAKLDMVIFKMLTYLDVSNLADFGDYG